MFQEAERLTPPPALWRRIEERVGLAPGGAREDSGWRRGPGPRVAASILLAAGVVGLGLGLGQFLETRSGAAGLIPAKDAAMDTLQGAAGAVAQAGETDGEWMDSELLGWHADLGELDEEVAETEEML
jgi:hypothetical protein